MKAGWLLCGLLGLPAAQAVAHPHVIAEYSAVPLHDGAGRISGLVLRWQLDAATSAQVRQANAAHRDGRLTPEELAAFARTNQTLLAPQRYLLQIDQADAGEPLAWELAGPVTAIEEEAEGPGTAPRIAMRFEVQFEPDSLSAAAAGSAGETAFTVSVFDPTWYIALRAAPLSAARADDGCTITTQRRTRLTFALGPREVEQLLFRCAPAEPARLRAHAPPRTGLP